MPTELHSSLTRSLSPLACFPAFRLLLLRILGIMMISMMDDCRGQLSPAAKAILMPFLVHDAVAGAGLIWCAPPFKARRFVERLFGGATV